MDATRENVWVGVRLRPLLDAEGKDELCWSTSGARSLLLLQTSSHERSSCQHTFDQVFPTECTADELYFAAAKERVHSALQGINATVFCYGATGSGKTFTMAQLMSLAVSDIFDTEAHMRLHEYTVRVSAMEIYNEKVRDLAKEGTEGQDLDVLEVRNRSAPLIKDLSLHSISSQQQLAQFVKAANARRTVRDTRANLASSRSHQLIQIMIESRPARTASAEPAMLSGAAREDAEATSEAGSSEDARPVTSATLTFVDLAGSERVSTAALEDSNQRARLLEGSTINRSLLTLGSVIRALGDASTSAARRSQVYVGYRDSKLTRVLRPSLEGNSRTAIVCCISPAAGAMDTTRSTLHFAERARQVSMAPTVNVTVSAAAQLRRLRAANANLQAQLDRKDFAKENGQLRAMVAGLQEQLLSAERERDAASRHVEQLQEQMSSGDDASSVEDMTLQETPMSQQPCRIDAGQCAPAEQSIPTEADLQEELNRRWDAHHDELCSSVPAGDTDLELIPAQRTPRHARGAAAGWAALQTKLSGPTQGSQAPQASPRSPVSSAADEPTSRAVKTSRLSRTGQEAEHHARAESLSSSRQSSLLPNLDRMKFEKRLLLQRVLQQEAALQSSREKCAHLQRQNTRVPERRGLSFNGPVPPLNLSHHAEDDWASPKSRQIVVRDVCKLWHHLRCKLSMRARFWMAFRGQEDHFWEQELRRLAHEISRLQDSPSSAVSPRSHATAVTAHKQLALAEKKLKWERSCYEAALAAKFSREQREALFGQWDIPPASARRKRQLVERLWSPDVLREEDGLERSAGMVLLLAGRGEERSDDIAHELIHSRAGGELGGLSGIIAPHIPSPLHSTVSRMVTSTGPRASAPIEALQALGPPRSTLLSSMWNRLTPRQNTAALLAPKQRQQSALAHSSQRPTQPI